MPNNIAFFGFATGRQVTIDSVTAPAWGMSPTGSVFDVEGTAGTSVTINVSRGVFEIAPEALNFSLTLAGFDTNTPSTFAQYHNSYHDKDVWWRCRTEYQFTAPTQLISIDAADGGNRASAGFGIGPLWAYVAQTPGDHIIDVVVSEPSSGKIGKSTIAITVKDPAVEFSGTQTIFVSTTGNYTNAPAGARTTTNINTALASMEAEQTTAHRVVLERGQTHTMTSTRSVQAGTSATLCHFRLEAREGSGAAPIVVDNTGADNDASLFFDNAQRNYTLPSQFTLSGIEFVGDHDPTNQSGRQVNLLQGNTSGYGSEDVLINSCEGRGFARFATFPEGGTHTTRQMTLCNCVVTDWAANAFFGGNRGSVTFLGNRFAQNVDALTDNGPGTVARTNSGWCVRVVTATRVLARANDTFANTGWSTFGSTMPAIQACWRILANGLVNFAQICFTHNVGEGGRFVAYLRPSGGGTNRNPANAFFEGNIMLSGYQADSVFQLASGGTTFKHNLLITAGDRTSGSDGGANITLDAGVYYRGGGSGPNEPANQTAPVNVSDNTFVNLSTGRSASGISLRDSRITMNITETGNLVHEPNAGVTSAGPFNTVRGFTPRFKGYRRADGTLLAMYATPAEAGDIYTKANGTGANTKPDYSAP